jgi:hypothetical protein
MPDESKNLVADAKRYRWLRTRVAHLLVGMLSQEGDSLADISAERADALVDLHIQRDSKRAANNPGAGQ